MMTGMGTICVAENCKLVVNQIGGKPDSTTKEPGPLTVCGDLCVLGEIKNGNGESTCIPKLSTNKIQPCEGMTIDVCGNLCVQAGKRVIVDELSCKTQGEKDPNGFKGAVSIDSDCKFIVAGIGGKNQERDGLAPLNVCGNVCVGFGLALDDTTGKISVDNIDCKNADNVVTVKCDLCVEGDILHSGSVSQKGVDVRLASNCAPNSSEDSLRRVLSLTPQSYAFKAKTRLPQHIHRGLIAQEVQEVLPDLVDVDASRTIGEETYEDLLSVDYSKLVVDLVGALQASHDGTMDLKTELNFLNHKVVSLKMLQANFFSKMKR